MKKIAGLLIILTGCLPALAQKKAFVTGGLCLMGGWDKDSKNATLLPALTLFPAIYILQKKDFALFAGTPASVGFSSNSGHLYMGVDLPVTVTMNFGYGFTRNSTARSGFLIGAGLGYHNSYNEIYNSYDVVEKDHLHFTGVLLHTGFAFRFDKKDKDGIWIRLTWLSRYPDHTKCDRVRVHCHFGGLKKCLSAYINFTVPYPCPSTSSGGVWHSELQRTFNQSKSS
jgi:hypothetical protein